MLSVESKSREKKRSRSVVVSSRVNLLMRMQHSETKEMDDHIITYYIILCIVLYTDYRYEWGCVKSCNHHILFNSSIIDYISYFDLFVLLIIIIYQPPS